MNTHSGIRIDRIPIEGLTGLVFVLGIMTLGLIALPPFRWLTLISLTCGALAAALLLLWRKYR